MGCPVSKDVKVKKLQVECDDYFSDYQNRHKKIITDEKVTNMYSIKSLLGTGTFSDVYFVEDKITRLPYAIKWIQLKSLASYETFVAEKKALESIEHPNIVKFKDVMISSTDAYIIMELATGGDLFEQIQANGHLKESECCRITEMLVSAIDYLHDRGITHRDMKAENVLYYTPGVNSRIVITDFGFASLRGKDTILNTVCGTPEYFSPELVLEKNYTNKVDIWALGCLVYFMLSGRLPFNGNSSSALIEKITNTTQSYTDQVWYKISDNATGFIDICLCKEQSQRATAKELLRNAWLSNDDLQSPQSKTRRLSLRSVTNNSDSNNTGQTPQPHLPDLCGSNNVCNRGPKKVKNFTNIRRLPPITSTSENCPASKTSLDSEQTTQNLSSIKQYLCKNIENAQISGTRSSQASTVSHQSLLLRRGLGSRRESYQLKDIILPMNLDKRRITKEDLFSVKSSSTSTMTSSPLPPSLTSVSNMGNYDSDSPLEFDDANNAGINDEDARNGEDGKMFFPPCFRRSISQQLAPTYTLNENIVSLFTPENLKQHNNKLGLLDKTVDNNIQLDSSFSISHMNHRHSVDFGGVATRLSRSLSPQKILSSKQNREKVSTWLCKKVPAKDLSITGNFVGTNVGNFSRTIFGANSSVHHRPQSFRNSNSITDKNLAKSF